MSVPKISLLVFYAVLGLLATTMQDSNIGQISYWILVGLAIIHLIEVAVYYKLCAAAGGSLGRHLANVFLFGALHVKEIKTASASVGT